MKNNKCNLAKKTKGVIKYIVFLIILTSFLSCLTLIKEQRRMHIKKSNKICKLCQQSINNNIQKDTLILNNGIYCINYDTATTYFVLKAGKLRNNIRIGKWYYFNKEMKIDRIIKYSNNREKIKFSTGIIDQSW